MAELLRDPSFWAIHPCSEEMDEHAIKTGFFSNDGMSCKSINFWEYLGHWNGEILWRHVETGETVLQPSVNPITEIKSQNKHVAI